MDNIGNGARRLGARIAGLAEGRPFLDGLCPGVAVAGVTAAEAQTLRQYLSKNQKRAILVFDGATSSATNQGHSQMADNILSVLAGLDGGGGGQTAWRPAQAR